MTVAEAKRRYIVYLTLMLVALGFAGAGIFRRWMPEDYPPLYPAIPLFFYVYGIVFIHLYKMFPEKGVQLHLIGKGVKLVLGIAVAVVYAWAVGTYIRAFLITFLGYYVACLVFDSCFFLNYEMDMKKEKKK